MARSLTDWGLSADDDEELRRYCDGRGTESYKLALLFDRVFEHEMRLEVFQDFYFPRRPERMKLSSLMTTAATLPTAIDWFGRLKQNLAPATGDGAALQQWLLDGTNGIVFADWLAELESKVADGSATRREHLAFQEIEKEVDTYLRGLVDGLNRTRENLENYDAFVAREDARRERAALDAAGSEARAARPPLTTPTRPPKRKYGELPRQPEITTYRKRKPD